MPLLHVLGVWAFQGVLGVGFWGLGVQGQRFGSVRVMVSCRLACGLLVNFAKFIRRATIPYPYILT